MRGEESGAGNGRGRMDVEKRQGWEGGTGAEDGSAGEQKARHNAVEGGVRCQRGGTRQRSTTHGSAN
jgi:hypothetical protein